MLTKRFQDALCKACELHQKQLRKNTSVPYVAHLLGAASIALEYGATEDEAIGALLHDAAEDQGGQKTIDLIREQFGISVADIVEGCTDSLVEPRPPWRERKETYLKHLRQASKSIRLVSASDKLHNARAILRDYLTQGAVLFDSFSGGQEGVLWYYAQLLEVFQELGPHSVAAELESVVVALLSATSTPSSLNLAS